MTKEFCDVCGKEITWLSSSMWYEKSITVACSEFEDSKVLCPEHKKQFIEAIKPFFKGKII